jgi:hypothetical protein
MNEFSEKTNFAYFLEEVAKLAWKRWVIGNSQERKTAPISWRKAIVKKSYGSAMEQNPPKACFAAL